MPAKKSTGSKSFPHKLHSLLESATENGFAHIISWQAGGKSFRVHQPKLFVKSILPQHFKQTKFKSFLRQLNIYGFQRIQHGPNKGGYAHQMLVQGFPEYCNQIKRISAPESKAATAMATKNIEKPAMVRKRSSISISNLSNVSGLSSLFRAAGGSTGSLGSIGSLGMNGPEGNFPSGSGQQNASFNISSINNHNAAGFSFFGSAGSLGNNSLAGNSINLHTPSGGKQNDLFNLNGADEFSAFGGAFYSVNKQNHGDNMSVLSGLSGGGLSVTSGSSLGLRMNGSDLNLFKEIFQPTDLDGADVPMLCPSTVGTSNGKHAHGHAEYVASNGYLQKKAGILEPSTDELLGLVVSDVPKNEDLNRSEAVFPTKLHRMLQDAKREGFEHIVSWIHGGTAFKVHDVNAFMQKIMPIYFDQSKFESFRRQLNLYGFTRVTRGPSRGMYYHQDFVQNDVSLCNNITRPKTVRNRRNQSPKQEQSAVAAY